MVVVLESLARPMVEVAFCRDEHQLQLWDSRLDYERSALALRLLAFGVVIACEGLYICAEIAPFERHPIVNGLLSEPALLKRKRRRNRWLQGWGEKRESATIGQVAGLMGRAYSPSIFREKLMAILGHPLPSVSKYSVDGGRTWHWLTKEMPERPILSDERVV